ncbi:MOSC domain-containing protein [Nocardioides zeae]|uniref:MOSC domain-containing protein n=1 Tax=Nocardioides zeae TaxID=1457234 RepID=A0A6P0HFU7_9ACTN|nr:MOSC domain-containing protein [Nocardioides zeae]NEN77194.1 MOSC domain-containing protein [Nocardioides zeae]
MHVHRLGVTLLKGGTHPSVPSLRFDADGPVGDRVLCALDVEHRAVLRTVAHPRLLAVRAQLLDREAGLAGGWVIGTPGGAASGPVEPDGTALDVDYWGRRVTVRPLVASEHAALLSTHLGRDVTLAVAPRGGIVYGAPVSLVTRATVRAVAHAASLAEPEETTAARLRATLVVDDGGTTPFAEESWAGRELEVGEARMQVRAPIVRCRVIDHHPVTGAGSPAGRGLLRAVARLRARPVAGVDAAMTQPGVVTVGDAVRLA